MNCLCSWLVVSSSWTSLLFVIWRRAVTDEPVDVSRRGGGPLVVSLHRLLKKKKKIKLPLTTCESAVRLPGNSQCWIQGGFFWFFLRCARRLSQKMPRPASKRQSDSASILESKTWACFSENVRSLHEKRMRFEKDWKPRDLNCPAM